jgi:hypothetical protein
MLQGSNVVGDLHNIVKGGSGDFLQLKEEEIREGGLGALNLRGENCFPSHIGIEEEMGIRQQGTDAIQATNGQRGALQQSLAVPG